MDPRYLDSRYLGRELPSQLEPVEAVFRLADALKKRDLSSGCVWSRLDHGSWKMSLVLCTDSEAGKSPSIEISLETLLQRNIGELSIGRDPTNDIVLQSSRFPRLISRFHAYIRKNANEFFCGDKNSTYGTYIMHDGVCHSNQHAYRFTASSAGATASGVARSVQVNYGFLRKPLNEERA
eukprot:1193326-Prorocentrum_minimum.AAC.2